MPTLLRIDSSALGGEASISRQLTDEYVHQWLQAHPAGHITTRDLAASHLPVVTAEWIGAAYTPADSHTPAQRDTLAHSDQYISELHTADEYVIGVPMYNFSIPASLKLWIDQIARVGKTFSYGAGGAEGLLKGKKATFLLASGGIYDQGTPGAGMNFVEPYLRAFFAFVGVTDVNFITAGGVAQLRSGLDRATFLRPAIESIQKSFPVAA
jgi:FMN-dependent NADH-azoreductase